MKAAGSLKIGFLFLCTALTCCRPGGEGPAQLQPATPRHGYQVRFTGYTTLNGIYVFQLHFVGLSAEAQPPLKMMGDSLGLSDYIVGPFHPTIVTVENPTTQAQEQKDESILELDKPGTGIKILVPYRKQVDLPD